MAKQVTATITFILHEENDESEASVLSNLIDCLEEARWPIAQYRTVRIGALTVEEAEDE